MLVAAGAAVAAGAGAGALEEVFAAGAGMPLALVAAAVFCETDVESANVTVWSAPTVAGKRELPASAGASTPPHAARATQRADNRLSMGGLRKSVGVDIIISQGSRQRRSRACKRWGDGICSVNCCRYALTKGSARAMPGI